MKFKYSESEKEFIKRLKPKIIDFSDIPLLTCYKDGLLKIYPNDPEKPIEAVWLSDKGIRVKKYLLFMDKFVPITYNICKHLFDIFKIFIGAGGAVWFIERFIV